MASFEQLLAHAAQLFEESRPLLPMYFHLIVSALFPIFAGAHASLSRPSSATKPTKKSRKSKDDAEDDDEETEQKMEGLSPRDAVIFPVTAAIVLAGLYWAIKRYGAELINLILGWYFAVIGVVSVATLFNDAAAFVLDLIFPTYFSATGKLWKVDGADRKVIEATDGEQKTVKSTSPLPGILSGLPLPKVFSNLLWSVRSLSRQKYAVKAFMKNFLDIKAIITMLNAMSAIFGVMAILYNILVAKPWWLINLQGFAVSYASLQMMSPTTFGTGTLILSGLFFYDIWAVFFTPLMVTVAKNLDQPIKLVFPRPDQPGVDGQPPQKSYSMLGLGDIVLPGLMIGLALRFDLYMFYLRKQKTISRSSDANDAKDFIEKAPYTSVTGQWGNRLWTSASADLPVRIAASTFPKPYFTASMIGYVVGMLATLVVMSAFQHAQPALLYLVPGVLVSLWGTAVVRGELKEMWGFSEAITGDALDEGSEEKKVEDLKQEKAEVDGIFASLWNATFGSSSPPEKKESDQSTVFVQEGKADETTSDIGKKGDAERPAKRETYDSSLLFSFSVKHHKSPIHRREVAATKADEGPAGDESGNEPQSRSSSEADSEDVVLVSHDIDGSPESGPTRSLRSMKGKAVKRVA